MMKTTTSTTTGRYFNVNKFAGIKFRIVREMRPSIAEQRKTRQCVCCAHSEKKRACACCAVCVRDARKLHNNREQLVQFNCVAPMQRKCLIWAIGNIARHSHSRTIAYSQHPQHAQRTNGTQTLTEVLTTWIDVYVMIHTLHKLNRMRWARVLNAHRNQFDDNNGPCLVRESF